MNQSDFVASIESEVLESSANDVISLLGKPPGKNPRPELTSLSEWYNGLSKKDQIMLGKVIEMTSHTTTFAFLNVLDGTRKIDNSAESGDLELRQIGGSASPPLCGPNSEQLLHEMLKDLF